MTLDASGNLLVGKTSATSNGGVIQTSNGITFPATQSACSDANTLDDYEEGTWTPVIVGTTTAGIGTYSVQSGQYTKVGRIVYYVARLAWSAHTGTGNMVIDGLPFTCNTRYHTGNYSFRDGLTLPANTELLVGSIPSSTQLYLYSIALGTANTAALAIDTAVTDFAISGWYEVA